MLMSENNIIKTLYIKNKQFFNYKTMKYLFFGTISCGITIYSYKYFLRYQYKKALKNSINIIGEELGNHFEKNQDKIFMLINSFISHPKIQSTLNQIFSNIINDKEVQLTFIYLSNSIIKSILTDNEVNNEIKENIEYIFLNKSIQNSIIDISKNIITQKKTQEFLEDYFVDLLQRPKINECFSKLVFDSLQQMIESPKTERKINDVITNALSSSKIKWKFLKKLIFPSWWNSKKKLLSDNETKI